MMDIVHLARLLAPLRPDQAKRWLSIRSSADAELRMLIDRQIAQTARRLLGDYESKVLLPPPPRAKSGGPIKLGQVAYDSLRWPAGLSKRELLQNLGIFGRSGAGKTNVVFGLLKQLEEHQIPFLFLDWKRTARHLLPRLHRKVRVYTPGRPVAPCEFNPFVPPPGVEPSVYLHQVVDVLGDAYTLGDGARSLLARVFEKIYRSANSPTADEVLKQLQAIPDTERVKGWKISAIRAIESVKLARLTTADAREQETFVKGLHRQGTIVELDALSQNGKQFFVPMLCLWLYYSMLGSHQREQLRLVVVIEEAHHVLHRNDQRARETILEMLLRQCREIGIATIVIDQHPHLITPAALGNIYTSLCLNQKDPADINKAAGLSMLDVDEKRYLTMLPVGQGIVKLQDRWTKPFLVEFPLVDVRKGAMTDRQLRRYLDGNRAGSGPTPPGNGESERVRRVRVGDSVLEDDGLRLLEDVRSHPMDGVKQRYLRLDLSAHRGTRLVRRLMHAGWLESEVVPVDRSRKRVLRMTPNARRLFGKVEGSSRPESVAHEYWKRFWADRLKKAGYSVQVEATRVGGRVDVLARRGSETIGVEIETGQSNVVANVKNGLRSDFDRFVVVATDKKALKKIERSLAESGLLISGRVIVGLQERALID